MMKMGFPFFKFDDLMGFGVVVDVGEVLLVLMVIFPSSFKSYSSSS